MIDCLGGSMRKILILEDSSTLVSIVKSYFEREGYDVLSAETVDGAMQILEDLPEIDSFIVDIVLRGMGLTGYDFIKKIRGIENYKSTPIIVTSSRSISGVEIASKKTGADLVIPKPYELDKLLEKVKELAGS